MVWPSSKFMYLTKYDRCPYVVDEYGMGYPCGVVELACEEDTSVFPNACSGKLPEPYGASMGLAVYAYRRQLAGGDTQAVLETRLVGQEVRGVHLMCSGTLEVEDQACLHVKKDEQAAKLPALPVPKPHSVGSHPFPQLGPAMTTTTTTGTTQTLTSVTLTSTTHTTGTETWTATTVTSTQRISTTFSTTATATYTYTTEILPAAASSWGVLPWILAASAAVIMAVLYLRPARERLPSRDIELPARPVRVLKNLGPV